MLSVVGDKSIHPMETVPGILNATSSPKAQTFEGLQSRKLPTLCDNSFVKTSCKPKKILGPSSLAQNQQIHYASIPSKCRSFLQKPAAYFTKWAQGDYYSMSQGHTSWGAIEHSCEAWAKKRAKSHTAEDGDFAALAHTLQILQIWSQANRKTPEPWSRGF
jgi:hypothetical protein